jgi:hypothetical protein
LWNSSVKFKSFYVIQTDWYTKKLPKKLFLPCWNWGPVSAVSSSSGLSYLSFSANKIEGNIKKIKDSVPAIMIGRYVKLYIYICRELKILDVIKQLVKKNLLQVNLEYEIPHVNPVYICSIKSYNTM